MKFRRGRLRGIALVLAGALALTGCGWFGDDSRVLLRSDPPITGMLANLQYVTNGAPNGLSSQNEISYQGINGNSPMKLLHTTFDNTSQSRLQSADVTAPNGGVVRALGMDKWSLKVGLTEYLDTQVGTYEQRDYLGNRVCGAKVRMVFKPNMFQVIQKDKYRRMWDSIAYYQVPCAAQAATPTTQNPTPDTAPGTTPGKAPVVAPPTPRATLDIANAKFLSLVILQQATPRVTGKPIIFNRGNAVTIVGGRFGNLKGGWWQSAAGLINASNTVVEMVRDLNKKGNDWLKFSDTGQTGSGRFGGLVYSAGDAQVYLSLRRLINRESDYLVNFRGKPDEPWKRVRIEPKYNYEWNDLRQNWKFLKGEDAPDIDEMIDQETGLPKDIDDPDHEKSKTLKEWETAGCQNCPNASLEQIAFVNPETNQPIYAMTIRGYLGAQSSLVMFGRVPSSRDALFKQAEDHMDDLGYTDALKRQKDHGGDDKYAACPIQRNEKGEKLDDDHQYSADTCAKWLREGALWDMLTGDATKFGFDVVGQFRVRDNSSYASQCSGSGEATSCTTVVTNRQLDANYLFSNVDDKLYKAWVILQLLGEHGIRTLGQSYVSGQYDGNGLAFAAGQLNVYNAYYSNLSDPNNKYANPEMVFGLDARASQQPNILAQAANFLYPPS